MQQAAGTVDEGAIAKGAAVEGRFGEGAVGERAALEFFIEGCFSAPVEPFERLGGELIGNPERIGASRCGYRRVIDDRLPAASAS